MELSLRILHLEDEPWDSDWVRDLLRQEGLAVELERVDTLDAFQQALERGEPALILSDYTIPGVDVHEALRLARQRVPDVPFVFVSGTLGEDAAIEALKQGATDYVLKHNIGRLVPAVRRALSEAEEHRARKQSEQALRRSAEEQRILSDALAQLLSAENPDRVVADLFPRVAEHLGVDTYLNFVVAENGAALWLHSHAGLTEEQAQALQRLEFGQSICGTVAQRREPMVVSDLQRCSQAYAAVARQCGLQLYACHPLLSGSRLLGTLAFGSRTRTQFTPEELEFLRLISDYTAVAIDRARTAQELRQSEERLRLALETAGLGTYERDLRTNEVRLNRTCRELLGVLEGVPAPDIAYRTLHPEDKDRVLAEVARAFDPALRAICGAEFRVLRPDGSVRWVAGKGRVVWEPGDGPPTPLKFLGILQDITENKVAEQALLAAQSELSRANSELERRVQDRTLKLQEAIGELEQMSYSMIHDMRAPLRAIQSFGSLLEDDPKNQLCPEGREMLGKMRAAASRMDHLVRDALNYTKVVREELPLRPVDVGALARGIVQTYPDFQPPKAQVTLASDLPWVLGNEGALTQCLSHLLDNAVKFAQFGQVPSIEVRAEPVDETWVRILVADKGVGIPPELHSKLFRLFQRLTRTGQGTGMGLAIVKKAAERMGGRVGLESEPGKGSSFWLELRKA